MDSAHQSNSANLEEQKLPRRDWILLPALSLLTILCLIFSAKLIAPLIYESRTAHGEDCMVSSQKNLGGIPNCVCSEKIAEGQLITYRFNSSGYRSERDFTPRIPGSYRIVVIGSSMAMGYNVPIEDAFATRLAPELSKLTGKKIEILNEAIGGHAGHPFLVIPRFQDALAAKPDMILRIVTPWDIQHELDTIPSDETDTPSPAQRSLIDKLIAEMNTSHWQALLIPQRFLYQSQTQYVNAYLLKGNSNHFSAGFLKVDTDEKWQQRLRHFDSADLGVEQRVKAAGVTMVTVLLPIRAQVAMISKGDWPTGFDPYKLDNELRAIVTCHGGTYLDILSDYRDIPNPEKGYYIEGHPNASGHALITRMLAKALTNGSVPALNVTPAQYSPQVQEK